MSRRRAWRRAWRGLNCTHTHTQTRVCVFRPHKCQGRPIAAEQTDDRDVSKRQRDRGWQTISKVISLVIRLLVACTSTHIFTTQVPARLCTGTGQYEISVCPTGLYFLCVKQRFWNYTNFPVNPLNSPWASEVQVNKPSPRPSSLTRPLCKRSAFKIDLNDSWLVPGLFAWMWELW